MSISSKKISAQTGFHPNKSFVFLVVLCLLSLVTFINELRATHAIGGDITYTCLGNNEYEIILTYYNDCDGDLAPDSAVVQFNSLSCNQTGMEVSLSPQNPSGQEVSAICDSELLNTTCSGGSLPGMVKYVYTGTVTLPAECEDWVISYNLCCRNTATTNLSIASGLSDNLYLQTLLNNVNGICSHSTYFTSTPTPFICANQSYTYNIGAVNPDADSLTFSMINPLNGPGSPISYNTPYSVTNPLSVSGDFNFNSETGEMTFTPDQQQVAVITVLVNAYANGQLISSGMRDLQFFVLNCNNQFPELSTVQNLSGGVQPDSNYLQVCPGDSLFFELTATDADLGDSMTITSNVAEVIPDAIFQTTQTGNPAIAEFLWIPEVHDMGRYIFTVSVTDDACSVYGQQIYTFVIDVIEGVSAGADLFYCPAGGALELHAFGGSEFNWTPSDGLSDTEIQNPLASPAQSTAYIVTSDLTGSCKSADTVLVHVVPDFTYSISSTDTICKNGISTLEVVPDNQPETYSYHWYPANGLSDINTATTYASPEVTTTYYVEITSDEGCTLLDSVLVVVDGVGPFVEVSAATTAFCPGDTVQLFSNIMEVTCGTATEFCDVDNPAVDYQFGTSSVPMLGTPFQGTNTSLRAQFLYHASDLQATGLDAGTINKLAFDIASKNSQGNYENFRIRVACTSANQLTTNFIEADFTEVFFQSTFATATGWNDFLFDTPYSWDGTSNLLIDICYQNPATLGGIDEIVFESTGYTGSIRAYNTTQQGCNVSANVFTYQQVPKARFTACPHPVTSLTYEWFPVSGLLDANTENPFAVVNQDVTYFLSVYDGSCTGTGKVSLSVDTSYQILVSDHIETCDDSVQLNVFTDITGIPPFFDCGANNSACTNGVDTLVVGTGTQSGTDFSYPSVYGNWLNSARHQIMFRADELLNAGFGSAATINEIALNIAEVIGTDVYHNFSIKMGCTQQEELSDWETGLEEVFAPQTISIDSGWNAYTLDTAYDWDGISNLVIEICFSNADSFASTFNSPVRYSQTFYHSVISRASNTALCANDTLVPVVSKQRPNIRFNYCLQEMPEIIYSWLPVDKVTNPAIADPIGIPGGQQTTFEVNVTFPNGCMFTEQIIAGPPAFETDISNDTIICTGDSIQLLASGGTVYQWSPADGLSCTDCPDPVATVNVSDITYTVSIDNGDGCINTEQVTIQTYLPSVDLGPDTLSCLTEPVELDAGAGFDSYMWSTDDVGQTITVDTDGHYAVTVTDQNGCSNAADVFVHFLEPLLFAENFTICEGESVTIAAESGFENYQWTGGLSGQEVQIAEGGMIVLTANHPLCGQVSDSFFVDMVVLDLNVFANPEEVEAGEIINLSADVSGGDMPYQFEWNPQEVINDPAVSDPVAEIEASTTFELIITDANGCTASATVFVQFNEPEDLEDEVVYIANVFAPGRGGVNSEFDVFTFGPVIVKEFRIFNRWGELMHDNADVPWDGRHNGSLQPGGTYVYSVVVEFQTGEQKLIQESFQLVR